MIHPHKDDCLIMVIDVQEKLCPTFEKKWLARMLDKIGLVALYARLEAIPVIVTEQYPQGLGNTVSAVSEYLDGMGAQKYSKTFFDCAADPRILKAVKDAGVREVVLVGMETHICVALTAIGLKREGFDVFVCRDAVIARTEEHHENGLELMRASGVVVTNAETCVFGMLHMSGGTTFKQILSLLKK